MKLWIKTYVGDKITNSIVLSKKGVSRDVFDEMLKEAVDAAFEAYLHEYDDAIYCIGSALGPHPFPMMVRDFQLVVGQEARIRVQLKNMSNE